MAPINRTGPAVLGRIAAPPAVPPEGFADLAGDARIVDGRTREDFAAGHIAGAVNVELDENFASYVGWVLPFDSRVLLVAPGAGDVERATAAAEAARMLARIGFERVLGFLEGGMDAWRAGGRPVAAYDAAGLRELCEALTAGIIDPSRLLDVRQQGEWDAGHVTGSRHAFVGDLAEAGEVPELGLGTSGGDDPWWVICASGHRASVAASLLDREGVPVRLVARGGVIRLLRTCGGLQAESAPR